MFRTPRDFLLMADSCLSKVHQVKKVSPPDIYSVEGMEIKKPCACCLRPVYAELNTAICSDSIANDDQRLQNISVAINCCSPLPQPRPPAPTCRIIQMSGYLFQCYFILDFVNNKHYLIAWHAIWS